MFQQSNQDSTHTQRGDQRCQMLTLSRTDLWTNQPMKRLAADTVQCCHYHWSAIGSTLTSSLLKPARRRRSSAVAETWRSQTGQWGSADIFWLNRTKQSNPAAFRTMFLIKHAFSPLLRKLTHYSFILTYMSTDLYRHPSMTKIHNCISTQPFNFQSTRQTIKESWFRNGKHCTMV